jgi:large subunit ribosomal protein L10e
MGLRPGRCYRNPKKGIKGSGANGHRKKRKQKRTYTRIAVKRPKRNYIGAAPALRIRQFNMGNPQKKYNAIADLCVKEGFDLRDNAIESTRMAVNRQLVKSLGKDEYFMKVRVYPSNIMRENKTAQGAGADRVSQGMSQSFGKPVGRSARLRKGQAVFSILYDKGKEKEVKDALMRAKARFSSDVEVIFHENVENIGTIPSKRIKEVKAQTPKPDETAEGKAEKKEGTEGEETKTEDNKESVEEKKADSKEEKK